VCKLRAALQLSHFSYATAAATRTPPATMDLEITSAAPRSAELRDSLCRALAWIVLVGGLLPHNLIPLSGGLDASYVWGINNVARTGAVPGRDYAFTYGPLGSIVAPLAGAPHLYAVAATRFFLHLLFALGLARALQRRPLGQVAGFTVAVLLGSAAGAFYEVQLLFWLALLFALATVDPPARRVVVPLSAALTVGFVLAKVSLGASALALLGGLALWLLARGAVPDLVRLGVALVASFGVAVALGFGSLSAAGAWIGAQRQFLAGMSAAMSMEGPVPELAGGVLCLVAYAALALYAVASRARLAAYLAISTPVVVLVFRHGFVRQDAHVQIFFGAVLLLASIGILFAGTARELAAVGAVAIVAAGVGCGSSLLYRGKSLEFLADGLSGFAHPLEAWGVEPEKWRTTVWRRRESLPAEWVAPRRAANLGVDAIPAELSLLAANDLRWVPSPTLQLYIAYTAALDERVARHFASAGAPDVLLARYEAIDGRHPLWDPPATWAAILRCYAPESSPRPDLVVLRRRPRPAPWRAKDAGSMRFAVGDWIDVPAAPDLLFAELDLKPTLAGRLRAALFRVPPVEAVVQFADGRKKRWRILPDTARDGLLMQPLPRNPATFPVAFGPADDPSFRVERLRITGPGARYLEETATVTWRAVDRS
jgi:hypothetical protein